MVESALAMIEFLRPLFIVTAVVFDVIVVVMLIIAPLLSGSSSCVARSVLCQRLRFLWCGVFLLLMKLIL